MEELQQLAAQIKGCQHIIVTSENKDRIVWKDDAPEELREWFRGVTGQYTSYSLAALDECYRILDDVCLIVLDETSMDVTADYLNDMMHDHEWASIFDFQLLEWVSEDLSRTSDVDECINDGSQGIIAAIQAAMNRTRSEMASGFLSSMLDKVGAKVEA